MSKHANVVTTSDVRLWDWPIPLRITLFVAEKLNEQLGGGISVAIAEIQHAKPPEREDRWVWFEAEIALAKKVIATITSPPGNHNIVEIVDALRSVFVGGVIAEKERAFEVVRDLLMEQALRQKQAAASEFQSAESILQKLEATAAVA